MGLSASGKAGSMMDQGQADALPTFLFRIAVETLIFLALALIAAALYAAFQSLKRADALAQMLARGRDGALAKGIAPAQSQRIDSRGLGDFFPMQFHGEKRLRRAEAAESPVGRGVGGNDLGTHAHVWALVRA